MKSALKFIALLIVVAGASFGASLWVSNHRQQEQEVTGFTQPAEYHPEAKGLQKLSAEEISSFFIVAGGGEVRYYVPRSGEIRTVSLTATRPSKLVATIKPRALSISWSADGGEVIAEYAAERIYTNLKTGQAKTLDTKIISPQFALAGQEVAYLYFDDKAGEGTISIADSNFKGFKNILRTRLKHWEIQWNGKRKLSLIATAAGTNLESLFVLDTESKGLTQLLTEQDGLDLVWSGDGERYVYSQNNGDSTKLFYMNVRDKKPVSLTIAARASSCAWASDNSSLYCGISEKTLKNSKAKNAEDAIVRIDTASRNLTPQIIIGAVDAGFVAVRSLRFVPGNQSLVFQNLKDGRLYALALP